MSTQAPDKKKTPLKWRLLTIAPPILLLAGILVLLYPVFATQYNNVRQERIASEFSAVADQAGPDAVAENLRRADEYNLKASESPILDPWLDAQRPGTAQYQDYLSQLNLEDAVAAEAAQVKGSVMKPWMIAVLASVAVILTVAGILWLRSRKRNDEEPHELVGAAALASVEAGDEAGDEAVAESAETNESGVVASADASPGASDTPTADLLTDTEQISEEEIDAGRTAALKKLLEERGKQ